MKYLLFFSLIFMFVSCQDDLGLHDNTPIAVGGSTNAMTIIKDNLFNIQSDQIDNYRIENGTLEHIQSITNLSRLETVYPFQNHILIGSEFGMYIYNLDSLGLLQFVSSYQHIRSCDPVIASETTAYVTLNNSRRTCNGGVNALHILNIEDIYSPKLLNEYELNSPLGLGIYGDYLYVCDQFAGLKVLDVSDPLNVKVIDSDSSVFAKDIIIYNNLLFLITDNSLVEYQLQSNGKLDKLSSVKI